MVHGKPIASCKLNDDHEYAATYKCRNCGQEFTACYIKDSPINILLILSDLTITEITYLGDGGNSVSRTDLHRCENGDVGMANLIGFRLQRLGGDK